MLQTLKPDDFICLNWTQFGINRVKLVERNLFIRGFIEMYKLDTSIIRSPEADNLLKIIQNDELDIIIINKDLNEKQSIPFIKYIINGELYSLPFSKEHRLIWLLLNNYCAHPFDIAENSPAPWFCLP